jgi:hypothetical protein
VSEAGLSEPGAERLLLEGRDRRDMMAELTPCMSVEILVTLQRAVREVFASPPFTTICRP